MALMLRLLFIGDVYGKPGRRVLAAHLPSIRGAYDVVIANGENAAGGHGLNAESAKTMFSAGVDVITLGNHAFGHRDVHALLGSAKVVRPLNYPIGTPGGGFLTIQAKGERLTVVNVMGRVFMDPLDDPFKALDDLLEGPDLGSVIVDFHAEATSEKAAFAYHLDGRVAAVLGTHTHVPTADARILPNGTGFQTDVGMTGPLESVIGAAPEGPIARFTTRMPTKLTVAEGRAVFNAAALTLDGGSCVAIERYAFTEPA